MTEPISRRDQGRANRQADRERLQAKFRNEAGLSDPPRDGETFEQFHARQLQAQTQAAQQSTAHLATIKLILQVFFWLSVAGVVILLIQINQAASRF